MASLKWCSFWFCKGRTPLRRPTCKTVHQQKPRSEYDDYDETDFTYCREAEVEFWVLNELITTLILVFFFICANILSHQVLWRKGAQDTKPRCTAVILKCITRNLCKMHFTMNVHMDTVLDCIVTKKKKYGSDVHLAAFTVLKLTFYFGCNAFILILCWDCSHWTGLDLCLESLFLMWLDLGGVDLVSCARAQNLCMVKDWPTATVSHVGHWDTGWFKGDCREGKKGGWEIKWTFLAVRPLFNQSICVCFYYCAIFIHQCNVDMQKTPPSCTVLLCH